MRGGIAQVRPWRSGIYPEIVAILLFPFALTAANNTWIFCKPVFLDRWIYTGLQLHFAELATRFWYTYYPSREPWLLAGLLAHHIFEPTTALYILHFAVFYLSAFSLYSAVLMLFSDRLAALSTVMLLATQSEFLTATGWDYVDGVYTAFIALSISALVGVALHRKWKIFACLWGTAVACIVSLYPLLAILLPAELVAFFLLNRAASRRSTAAVAFLCMLGGIATILILCCLASLAGGPFNYFQGQLMKLFEVEGNLKLWYLNPSEWVWASAFLIIPFAIAAYSVLASVHCFPKYLDRIRTMAGDETGAHLFSMGVANLGALCTFIALEADHFLVLQFDDKVNALLPFAFCVIGGAIATALRRISKSLRIVITIAVVVISLGPWILASFTFVHPHEQYFMGTVQEISWLVLIFLALVACSLTPRAGLLTTTIALTAVGFGAANDQLMTFPPNPYYKQGTLAVIDASERIAQYNPDAEAHFWFNLADRSSSLERDVNSTYLDAFTKINENFPSLVNDDGTTAIVSPGDRLIILFDTGDAIAEANRSLAREGVFLRPITIQEEKRPGVDFRFAVATVQARMPKRSASLLISPSSAALAGGLRAPSQWPMSLSIPAKPWAYATLISIPHYRGRGDITKGILEIQTRTTRGELWVGILSRDTKSFIRRRDLSGAIESRTIFVNVDLKNASAIVLQNGPSGRPGQSEVDSARVIVPLDEQ